MEAGIPVIGATISILFMVVCFSSPVVGVIVDWLARHHGSSAQPR